MAERHERGGKRRGRGWLRRVLGPEYHDPTEPGPDAAATPANRADAADDPEPRTSTETQASLDQVLRSAAEARARHDDRG